jgi:hypothetical protein
MWRVRLAHYRSPDLHWFEELSRADRVAILAVWILDGERSSP